ncbi:MAG: ribose 5-phosphate isomerase B [Flavobacteriales bacterium]|nr:ribose 5-phosphate isomerase B [Flavobacteriales bacterium]
MRIAIGSDHAGIDLKHAVKEHLKARGAEAVDKGAHVRDSVDYPDYAHAVATAVTTGDVGLGIVICGSGNGVNITANKHAGVRSALAWIEEVAELARAHNDANVLALPARFITEELALRIVDAFLDASFEGGRHARRVEKIEPEQAERN